MGLIYTSDAFKQRAKIFTNMYRHAERAQLMLAALRLPSISCDSRRRR